MTQCATSQIELHIAGHDTLSTRARSNDISCLPEGRRASRAEITPTWACFWCVTYPRGQDPARAFLDLCLRPSQGLACR